MKRGSLNYIPRNILLRGLKRAIIGLVGFKTVIKKNGKGVCTAEYNFMHRAIYGFSAQGGEGEDLGDKPFNYKLTS